MPVTAASDAAGQPRYHCHRIHPRRYGHIHALSGLTRTLAPNGAMPAARPNSAWRPARAASWPKPTGANGTGTPPT